MEHQDTVRRLLAEAAAHPALGPRDIFKFLYQSAFGCEHLLASRERARAMIEEEVATADPAAPTAVTELDGAYARVPLAYLTLGLTADTLAHLFCLSAKGEDGGAAALAEKLAVAETLAAEGRFPFSHAVWREALSAWAAAGYPPVRHTEAYRAAYRPAYRVIARRYLALLPLLAAIDRRLAEGRLILAVEGGSASGKTTLGALLRELYGATVLHTDDFFLRPEQRTAERLLEVGGNFDRERFATEVVAPLVRGGEVTFRRYDCHSRTLAPPTTVSPARLTVVEGVYSTHPDLGSYYGLSAFLAVSPTLQRERIGRRNTPEDAARFFSEWIPRERAYFETMRTPERCDLCLTVDE